MEKDETLRNEAANLESIILTDFLLCDFEMITNGGFAPLDRFMGEADYREVLSNLRLKNGVVFPIPVTLPVNKKYDQGVRVALRDMYGNILAIMTIEECYAWNKKEYSEAVLGSYDKTHPLVSIMDQWGNYNIAGPIEVITLPQHYDFKHLRMSPKQVREKIKKKGNKNLVAFQTRNPLHRAHEELTKKAAAKTRGTLLLHPVVGMTKPGDVDYITRVKCYEILVKNYYKDQDVILSLLPLAMRMAGPREALWHAIIRKNYGATHFIVGRDHAGPGKNSKGEPFYDPYDAQKLVLKYADEIGIKILTFNEMVYIEETNSYKESSEVKEGETIRSISGTQVRTDYLAKNRLLPGWFTRPEVADILNSTYISRLQQGYCLWFTGLSASGKSTIARAVESELSKNGRATTVLDGDIVRRRLSKGLGFNKEDRNENVKRIGYVASQIVKHNGIVICAAISPYRKARETVRRYFDKDRFIEIYVSTPIEVCEQRDPKGLYSLARQGKLSRFTGVDDVYEPPKDPEVIIDTSLTSLEDSVLTILKVLSQRGFYDLQNGSHYDVKTPHNNKQTNWQ